MPALAALHAAGHRVRAVYTQPDRPAGARTHHRCRPCPETHALELGLRWSEQPATRCARPRLSSSCAATCRRLMVVVAYGLHPAARQFSILPVLGCLNIHGSLLPRWRGAAPIARAIEAGDSQTGVSIMKMDAGLDTGPVLLARATPIEPRETAASLHDRLAHLGADAVLEAIDGWQHGHISPQPQPDTGASYARKIERGEAAIELRHATRRRSTARCAPSIRGR